ncbi:RHS repeat-associated core domain protein [Leptospira wolffii serovar Khorat str. Khorat-H2]|nr:RHS repeat-associated core domain protein [Leptospira wolffii serovar Khorat str. Khorat-H2]
MDSVAHVLDENGHTLSRMQYEPYGETLVQRGNLDFVPKYNSQELDRETNFYFYNARYYDPQIARFTSADTVVPETGLVSQSWNRFSYVAGNPIRYKDPTGHLINSPGTKTYIPPSTKSEPSTTKTSVIDKPEVSSPSKAVPKRLSPNIPKRPPTVPKVAPKWGSPKGGGGLAGTLVTFGLFALAEHFFGPQNSDSNPRIDTLVMQYPDGVPLGSKGKIGFDIPDTSEPKEYKTPKKGSGKERASDVPGWAKGKRPYKGESGEAYADRLLREQYGEDAEYKKGAGTEFNKIKKHGDRGYE